MNYFELYDIPLSFRPDQEVVKQRYYALIKQFHPDRYTLAEENEKVNALNNAALNNTAYKVLQHPDKTMGYVLQQLGLLEDEAQYKLPPDFLMEMMDLNELLSDYEMEQHNLNLKEKALKMLTEQLDNWNNECNKAIELFERGDRSANLLSKLKDFYFRKKYLLRISERLHTFASPS